MTTFHVISILPKVVEEYCNESILKKAKEKNLVDFKFYNLRDFTKDKHGKVDDRPYAGGPGMVMTAQPILDCVESIKGEECTTKRKFKIINFVPSAQKWTNVEAKKVSKKYTDIILVCGRYEGIDYRVQKILKAQNVSVGDFVLTGGEIPAMIVIDSVARQIKGVLGDFNSLEESRNTGNVSEEFYTRPEILEVTKEVTKIIKNKSVTNKISKKYIVPKVFLSGNPKLIQEYKNGKM